jgi:hypothetical protein
MVERCVVGAGTKAGELELFCILAHPELINIPSKSNILRIVCISKYCPLI